MLKPYRVAQTDRHSVIDEITTESIISDSKNHARPRLKERTHCSTEAVGFAHHEFRPRSVSPRPIEI